MYICGDILHFICSNYVKLCFYLSVTDNNFLFFICDCVFSFSLTSDWCLWKVVSFYKFSRCQKSRLFPEIKNLADVCERVCLSRNLISQSFVRNIIKIFWKLQSLFWSFFKTENFFCLQISIKYLQFWKEMLNKHTENSIIDANINFINWWLTLINY